MALLELRDVRSGYDRMEVLHGIDLTLSRGDIVAVLGPNGAGKSVLLKTIIGILPCTHGEILLDGEPIGHLPPSGRYACGISFIPQARIVFPRMTVEENLRMGALRESNRTRVHHSLEQLYAEYPMLAGLRRSLAGNLSGGQQKLLALARALMQQPKIMLLDEPSVGLDPIALANFGREIGALNRRGVTIMLVEQNVKFALATAQISCFLDTGRISRVDHNTRFPSDQELLAAYFGSRAGGREQVTRPERPGITNQ
jgi:branched-chain amino acid transport system ATP-binding protein